MRCYDELYGVGNAGSVEVSGSIPLGSTNKSLKINDLTIAIKSFMSHLWSYGPYMVKSEYNKNNFEIKY